MARNLTVSDFSQKVDLLVRSGRGTVTSLRALSEKVQGIDIDYLQRQVAGTRPLSERVFLAIVKAAEPAGLQQSDWFEPLETFGFRLGLSAPAIAQITGGAGGGIDFYSRNADPQNLQSLHRLIGGYWECFYYSVSTFGKQRICHDLMVIDAPDAQGLLPCRIVDASFTYQGHCFPVHGAFLYLILEKTEVHDEIAVYLVNRPERAGAELDGVVLCTTGGVDDPFAVPCAARVAFRFLAATREELLRLHPKIRPEAEESFETAVRRALFTPPYIDPSDVDPDDERLSAVKRRIDNTVPPDQVPFALRMERVRRNVIRQTQSR